MERLFDWIAYRSPAGVPGFILSVLAFPLYFISLLYRLMVQLRLIFYKKGLIKSGEAGIKVISVGNITVGGTGKTPTVELIARKLTGRGYRVAILSRGYKGKRAASTNIVSDGKKLLMRPEESGDEPYMLASRLKGVPVLVGSDRFELAGYAEKKFHPDAVILDDGFQHIKLKRDLNILLFDGEKGVGNGQVIPRGPLREPLSAVKRADIVMVNKTSSATEGIINAVKKEKPSAAIFTSRYSPERLRQLWGDKSVDIQRLAGMKVMTLSAIANPSSFSSLIASLGGEVTGETSFPDHHSYRPDDVERALREAERSGAEAVLTTGKDAVKLEQMGPVIEMPFYALEIVLDLQGEEENFINKVIKESGLDEKQV